MVTLREVAEDAGVSTALASRVLNPGKTRLRCTDETRETVLTSAKKLGYRRNPHSFALLTGRTMVLGCYLGQEFHLLSHPAAAFYFTAIQDAAARMGYSLVMITSDRAEEFDLRTVDGVIALRAREVDREAIHRFVRDVPVFSHESAAGTEEILSRSPLCPEGVNVLHRMSAEYLYDLGHRRILHVELPAWPKCPASRIFKACAEERGIEVHLTQAVDDWEDRLYPNALQALQSDDLPTAVYAFDDDLAQRVVNALTWRGVSVPRQVSVFSRETYDTPVCKSAGITGIMSGYGGWWQAALTQFVHVIEDRQKRESVDVPLATPRIVERRSCGPAPA